MSLFQPAPFFAGLDNLSLTTIYRQLQDQQVTDDVAPDIALVMPPGIAAGDLCIVRQLGFGTLPVTDYFLTPTLDGFTQLRVAGTSDRFGWVWLYKILDGTETVVTGEVDDGSGWDPGDQIYHTMLVTIYRPNRQIFTVSLISEAGNVNGGTSPLYNLPVATRTTPVIIMGEGHSIRDVNMTALGATMTQPWDYSNSSRTLSTNIRHHWLEKLYNTAPVDHTVQYGNFENPSYTLVGTVVVT